MDKVTHSVIVIGSGPAGHTACIYLARANLNPLMLEGDSTGDVIAGGLLTTTKIVENYPGFHDGIDGFELTDNLKSQSLKYGAKIISETVTHIDRLKDNMFLVHTSKDKYQTKAIIIATGSTPRKLNIPSYNTFWHKGISTCAVCDAALPMFRNVPIAVVGGGDSACEEALHITHTASMVYLIHRGNKFRASKIMCDRVLTNPKIKVLWNTEVDEILGTLPDGDKSNKGFVNQLVLKNTLVGSKSLLNVKGLFVAIGHDPNTKFIRDLIACDSDGYVITHRDMSTSVEGIWACGDVQDKKYKQAITAAGSGCIAALEAEKWLQ